MTRTSNRSGIPIGLAMLAFGTIGLLAGHGCGSVTNDRDDAISRATNATCARYQTCGLIGDGANASYATVGVCQDEWRAKFSNQWTVPQCQGHIDHAMLDVCLAAINGTSCTSVLDVLTTFYVKCGIAPICDVPPDAGARD
ncbi:MAG TPA: DUF6184 family natural product biosynthesis lipoprotein [Polyangia bacterium]|nr:DUF6184 family natural product biosynthesis lipoprotein [Polyangia bacterium]